MKIRGAINLLILLPVILLPPGCAKTLQKPPKSDTAKPGVEPLLGTAKDIITAQRGLKRLGYDIEHADGKAREETEHAVRAFQKDNGLLADGRLTTKFVEHMRTQLALLPSKNWINNELGIEVTYSDRASERLIAGETHSQTWLASSGARITRPTNFLLDPKDQQTSALPNFLQPLRPGASASYAIRNDGKITHVSCKVGRLTRMSVRAGTFDALAVTCEKTRESGDSVTEEIAYAPKLRLVIQRQTRSGTSIVKQSELVSLRPPSGHWPVAARTGFDWALSHALDNAGDMDGIKWSSSGVAESFRIRTERDASTAALPGAAKPERCARFDIVKSGTVETHYPGLACADAAGRWTIPGSRPIIIARQSEDLPALNVNAQPLPPVK